jgi:hypothetical protein
MPRDINWIGLLFVTNDKNEKIPINAALKNHHKEMLISRKSKERDIEYSVSWIQKNNNENIVYTFPSKFNFLASKKEYIDLNSGAPKVKNEIIKFFELEPGIFYPEEIVISRYNKEAKNYSTIFKCRVVKAVFNKQIDDKMFDFNYPEGVEVFDIVQKKVWVSNATGGFGRLATDENGEIIKMSMEDKTDSEHVSNNLPDRLLKSKRTFTVMTKLFFLGALMLVIVFLLFYFIRRYWILNSNRVN